MKPIYQSTNRKPEGNCMQAAVASLLELELDEVPNFNDGEPDGVAFWDRLDDFLEDFGLKAMCMPLASLAYEDGTRFVPPDYHLIFGDRNGEPHVIVGWRGAPVHDPMPDTKPTWLDPEGYILFVAALELGRR